MWNFVQGDRNHLAIRGHNAKTREEFRELVETEQWDKLFRVVTIKKGQYTYGPQGTLHGSPYAPTERRKKIWWSLDLKRIQILHTDLRLGKKYAGSPAPCRKGN